VAEQTARSAVMLAGEKRRGNRSSFLRFFGDPSLPSSLSVGWVAISQSSAVYGLKVRENKAQGLSPVEPGSAEYAT